NQVINFFEGIQSVENLKKAEPRKIIQFVSAQLKNGELTDWRIALMNKKSAEQSKIHISGVETIIGQWFRREGDNNSNEDIFYVRKSHIISRKDEFIDLSEHELEDAKRLSGNVDIPNGKVVRERIRDPKKPLLILYLLDPDESLGKYPMQKGINPFVGS